jgi:hypothetical protein
MRFMMIMIPTPPKDEVEWGPTPEAVSAMSRYNDELTKAGVLLALDGLHPTSKGARVSFAGGKATVTDGPFTEAKEMIGGYWLIQAKSKDEAVQWASRCPAAAGDTIEVRQTCSRGSAASTRPTPSCSTLPRSPTTRASVSCCSTAPPPARGPRRTARTPRRSAHPAPARAGRRRCAARSPAPSSARSR